MLTISAEELSTLIKEDTIENYTMMYELINQGIYFNDMRSNYPIYEMPSLRVDKSMNETANKLAQMVEKQGNTI